MSKIKYVYPYKNTDKWITQINYNSKNYTLGIFASPEEAAQVRKNAETAKNNGTFPEFFTKLRTRVRRSQTATQNDALSAGKSSRAVTGDLCAVRSAKGNGCGCLTQKQIPKTLIKKTL
jgi:hypothetical protein